MIKLLPIIMLVCFLASSCSTDAPKLQDLQSKELKPTDELALIYFFREGIHPSFIKSYGHALPFTFGSKEIGKYSKGQYLFYYAYPMQLQLVGQNNSLITLEVEAGETYFVFWDHEGSLDSESFQKIIPQSEGRKLLKQYFLSAHRNNVILGARPNNAPAATKQKTTYSHLSYDDNTKVGSITMLNTLSKRNIAINQIEKICSTKNIAIKVGADYHQEGATYATLNEKYIDGQLSIKFKCLY